MDSLCDIRLTNGIWMNKLTRIPQFAQEGQYANLLFLWLMLFSPAVEDSTRYRLELSILLYVSSIHHSLKIFY